MICWIVRYQYYLGHISCGTILTGVAIVARQSIDSESFPISVELFPH